MAGRQLYDELLLYSEKSLGADEQSQCGLARELLALILTL